MADIKYIYREWQEQLDALEELISGWSSIRDSLQAADDNLEDIDRDVDDKDVDRAITSFHSSLRDEIDTLCGSYAKLKNYCERIGDVIRDTVDTPFYKKMDDFTQSMKGLSINNYTTENTLDVTTNTNYEGVDISIRKQSISIQDIFKSSPTMDKMLKEDYNAFMALPDTPDLSYGDYKQAISYTRSFDYKSIEDSQLSKEFWTSLGIGAVIVIASVVCPPAGIALGIAYGTLELGSAASGRDWLTQRELGKGEQVMRGTFALFDIIPGVRAFGASMHTARVATGTLGQADNVLQVMGKCTLQRTKNFAGQMGKFSRRTGVFGKLLVSNTDEAVQLFMTKSKGVGNRALSAGRSSIDEIGRKSKDLVAKGKNILSGNFDDIKRYMKSLMPGEYVLVATPDGSVFRIAKSELGESSAELVARNQDDVLHTVRGIEDVTHRSSDVNFKNTSGVCDKIDDNWQAYFDDIENKTVRNISQDQKQLIMNEINNNSHNTKLTGQDYKDHRKDFNDQKSGLIEQWEEYTGQIWPTYDEDILSKSGKVYIKAGSNYDAHEIIPNVYNSPLEWWNIHPAANPTEHQGGIHGSGAAIKNNFD